MCSSDVRVFFPTKCPSASVGGGFHLAVAEGGSTCWRRIQWPSHYSRGPAKAHRQSAHASSRDTDLVHPRHVTPAKPSVDDWLGIPDPPVVQHPISEIELVLLLTGQRARRSQFGDYRRQQIPQVQLRLHEV